MTAWTQSCPRPSAVGRSVQGVELARAAPRRGPLRRRRAEHIADRSSGDPELDAQIDPVTATPCATYRARDADGVAVYRHPVTRAFTVLGLPTIDLDVARPAATDSLIARLWDEAPDGIADARHPRRLPAVPGQTVTSRSSCFGGGWRFEPGHTARWTSPGSEAPFFKPADDPYDATISERPASRCQRASARTAARSSPPPTARRALSHDDHRHAAPPRNARRGPLGRTDAHAAQRPSRQAATPRARTAREHLHPVSRRQEVPARQPCAVRAGLDRPRGEPPEPAARDLLSRRMPNPRPSPSERWWSCARQSTDPKFANRARVWSTDHAAPPGSAKWLPSPPIPLKGLDASLFRAGCACSRSLSPCFARRAGGGYRRGASLVAVGRVAARGIADPLQQLLVTGERWAVRDGHSLGHQHRHPIHRGTAPLRSAGLRVRHPEHRGAPHLWLGARRPGVSGRAAGPAGLRLQRPLRRPAREPDLHGERGRPHGHRL